MADYESQWRAFEHNEVTHSAAHYLLAITALAEGGRDPRAVEVARQLDVSRAAVSLQIRTLRAHGLVDVGDDRRIRLTRRGADLVARVVSKREVVRLFLSEVLGVDPATAERDACKIEHLISEESAAALVRFMTLLRDEPAALASILSRLAHAAGSDDLTELRSFARRLQKEAGTRPQA